MSSADLTKADLTSADLEFARLDHAALIGTDLRRATLIGSSLNGAQLWLTRCGRTVFQDTDLSTAIGLDNVEHSSPSALALSALAKSGGAIPEVFLRGCGLSDWEIVATKLYAPGLSRDEIDRLLYAISDIRSGSPIQIHPLFISYTHSDAAFGDHLETALNDRGIRFWRDAHDLKAGRIERQIERAISLNPTVLLILSSGSVRSDWVEWEASKARDLEKDLGRDVLCLSRSTPPGKPAVGPSRSAGRSRTTTFSTSRGGRTLRSSGASSGS